MLTAYFNLREDDIQSLKLNSKVRIDNSWWTINKVIDYDCNANNLTKVELMSADTEIDLAPFKKGDVTPTTVGDLSSHTGSIHWNNSFVGNTIPSTSVSAIYGQGNVIQPGVNGIIVGNGKMLDQTGIVTERLGADVANVKTLNLSGGVIGSYRELGLDGNYYLSDNDFILNIVTGSNVYYLPLTNTAGQLITIKNSAGTNDIKGQGQLIDGGGTITLTGTDVLRVVSDGNNWLII